VDHTAENTYKGLVGFWINFNEFDTGDENTGLHLPSFPSSTSRWASPTATSTRPRACWRLTPSTPTGCWATSSW
jgi:hypothetical protein